MAALDVSGFEAALKRKENSVADGSRKLTGPTALTGGGDKYQRILDAAVEVIAENGYFGSPVSAIAARAGVADGTIYLYFKSKDDVLRTAIDTVFDSFHRQVQEEFRTLTESSRTARICSPCAP